VGALTNVQLFFKRFPLGYLPHHLVLHSNDFRQQIELTCPARHHLSKKAILLNGELLMEKLLFRTFQGDLAKW
jgi:DNA polymerase IIIc chi subunit